MSYLSAVFLIVKLSGSLPSADSFGAKGVINFPGREISPRIWGVYCVDRVEMCGQILLDIQRKVESVYEVKGKI